MSEEKVKILEMLREGKINTAEALELLKHVRDESEGTCDQGEEWKHDQEWTRNQGQEWEQKASSFRPDFGWINEICLAVGETTRNLIFPDEFLFNARQENFKSVAPVSNFIRSLIFEGKNAPMRLEAYSGSVIDVDVNYKARGQMNPRFNLNEDNGIYHLSYDDNALYMLGITIRVPENVTIGNVRLKSKNGSIAVNGITSDKIELNTKNESIKVFDTKGESLFCETKNSSIVLNAVSMKEIDAQTSSSKISLDDVEGFRARLVTSNAKIEVKDSSIAQLYAKTSNSSLRFDGFSCKKDEPICSIDAITSNGQITMQLPHKEIAYKLRASTTQGSITGELNGLDYQVNESNYVEAQTQGYQEATNKLSLNLQTTNRGIYVWR